MSNIDEEPEAVSGFPEPPGKDPGDRSRQPTPYTSLNTPVGGPHPDSDGELGGDNARDGDDLDP
jgi:hypothetical protein